MRRLAAVTLALSALAGCSSARMEPELFSPTTQPEEPLSGACLVTIQYPESKDGPSVDEMLYAEDGRLLEMNRTFADGLASTRRWTWSEDGRQATRTWADGSRTTLFDDQGRPVQSDSFDADGTPTWRETVDYDADGLIALRQQVRLPDQTVWATTTYDSDGERIVRSTYSEESDPTAASTVSYDYDLAPGGLERVEAYDLDDDGVIDYKTARVIAPNGLVERAVDRDGKLIDYDYEGTACENIGPTWIMGEPLFIDL